MAAFDVTTKPERLSLKPGTAGSIMVVVSNRLGRPVLGVIEGMLTPASASRWMVPPADPQRRYEADPAATTTYEFKIAVPEKTPAQAVQFTSIVRDSMEPDDHSVQGQTVAINVTPTPLPPPNGKIKWWVWLIVALVVLGAGFGIYMFAIRQRGVPNVVGMTPAEAREKLTKAGFVSITLVDTLGPQNEDTNRVARQDPKARSKLPPDSIRPTTPVTLVVNRPMTEVPAIVDLNVVDAINGLQAAGLTVGGHGGIYTAEQAKDNKIQAVRPGAGTKVVRGSAVTLVIYAYSATPPPVSCKVRPWECVLVKPEWDRELKVLKSDVLRTDTGIIVP